MIGRRRRRFALLFVALLLAVSSCADQSPDSGRDTAATGIQPRADAPAGSGSQPAPDTAIKPEPVPYVPAGRPGSTSAYSELIARLESEVPAELRNQVPWPDLRNPDPITAQVQIFDLWIWMGEHHPDPALVEAMAAPGSPSREEIVPVFGRLDADGLLETRIGLGYQAFDHVVVTFESAGLPLWLARDVPEDAVVVYYSDQSGPVEVTDRESGALYDTRPSVPVRTWLSIMVPTEVGWQLWRDELIEPNDAELQVPDLAPPGANDERPRPGV